MRYSTWRRVSPGKQYGIIALLLRRSRAATHMEKEIENGINAQVREVYEPRYGRSLSDEEVHEIRQNLRSFAEGIMSIAERLHNQAGNLSEGAAGMRDIGHEI